MKLQRTTLRLLSCTARFSFAGVTLGLLLLSLTGCRTADPKVERQNVTAADFAGPPGAGFAIPSQNQTSVAPKQPDVSPTATSAPALDTLEITPAVQTDKPGDPGKEAASRPLIMDAMVGQVNGKAIYARTVFEPLKAQLTALGKTLPPSVFKQRATELIVGQLETIVTNALILGESERDLSIQEQYGLVAMLKAHREDLLRQFGEGSAAVADKNSLERTGKNVDEQVSDYRERVLVGRYISKKISPKINVTRKDIERYYQNHRDEFNPPAGRTLRLIMTSSKADAEQIQKMLETGTPFDQAAKSPANQYRASEGGLMPDRVHGDNFSGFAALNQAMLKLKTGEHSPMIQAGGSYWWIKVESYETGKSRSLEEVQLQIRQLLEDQQRNALGLEFRHKLLTEGSYNPIDQMTHKLVDIAMSRYSQPQ